mmetsp:Transcript_27337/g.61124  ORF Transcript_27337/g.61124 Transcript_27337/m.61124 type:complete len:202 (+) Transcript_27337:103-708(+)
MSASRPSVRAPRCFETRRWRSIRARHSPRSSGKATSSELNRARGLRSRSTPWSCHKPTARSSSVCPRKSKAAGLAAVASPRPPGGGKWWSKCTSLSPSSKTARRRRRRSRSYLAWKSASRVHGVTAGPLAGFDHSQMTTPGKRACSRGEKGCPRGPLWMPWVKLSTCPPRSARAVPGVETIPSKSGKVSSPPSSRPARPRA